MIHGQCRSHYVSHFAAFFIVARAKISVVESCLGFSAAARAPTPRRLLQRCTVWMGCVGRLVRRGGRGARRPPPPLVLFSDVGRMCGIDPSAGSPTETLLRLLLPLNDKVQASFEESSAANRAASLVPRLHRTIQSVGATGGVYKGQGRNQRELMTRAY